MCAFFIIDLDSMMICKPLMPILALLLPANEVWGKVMFLHLSVILFTRELCVSQQAMGQGRVCISACNSAEGMVKGNVEAAEEGVGGGEGAGELLLWPSGVAFCYGLLVCLLLWLSGVAFQCGVLE